MISNDTPNYGGFLVPVNDPALTSIESPKLILTKVAKFSPATLAEFGLLPEEPTP